MNRSVIFSLGLLIGASTISGQTTATHEMTFEELAQTRHSGYAFDSSRNVPKEALIQMAKAAWASPSSYNDQPWRFIFCDREKDPAAYAKALNCLVDANRKWAQNAPVLIIVVVDPIASRDQKPNLYADYDTGAATMSLVYEATALGLMAHQMGGFDAAKTTKEFALPPNLYPKAIVAIGYESAAEASKVSPKTRQPFGDLFFWGSWGKGMSQ